MHAHRSNRILFLLVLGCFFSSGNLPAPAEENDTESAKSQTKAVVSMHSNSRWHHRAGAWHTIADQSQREWKEAQTERVAQGTLVAASQKQALVRRSDGKTIPIALTRLSDGDRLYVRQALASLTPAGKQPTTPAASVSATPSDEDSEFDISAWLPEWLREDDSPETSAKSPLAQVQSMFTLGSTTDASAESIEAPRNIIYVRFSRPFLNELVAKPVDTKHPVSEVVLGHQVTGTSRVRGNIELVLVPHDAEGCAELRFFGTSAYDTIAHAGAVQVRTRGVTEFVAQKPLRLCKEGLVLTPASTRTRTRSTIAGIDSNLPGLRGLIATRVGWDRAAEDQQQARTITAQRTAERISKRFDRDMENYIRENKHQVLARFTRLRQFAELTGYNIELRTTDDAVEIAVLSPETDARALVDAPRQSEELPDVEVQIHAALVNQFFSDGEFRTRIKPIFDLLTTTETSTVLSLVSYTAVPVERPFGAHWSDDRNWFTLEWNRDDSDRPRPSRAEETTVAGNPGVGQ